MILTKIKKLAQKILPFKSRKLKQSVPVDRMDSDGSINSVKDLSNRFCTKPFRWFEILEDGRAFSCCPSWVTTPLGNVNDQAPSELWNSAASQAIRKSILDGSFAYCDHKICPMIQNDTLPTKEEASLDPVLKNIIDNDIVELDEMPSSINFANDPSCNLSCPSCRVEKIIDRDGPKYERRLGIHDKVVQSFMGTPSDRHFIINVTGSGDPFASRIFRDFLFAIEGRDFPNLKVNLQTNAVMFTPKNWQKISKIHANLGYILVSFDAATPETYKITRRGGDWDLLLSNFKNLVKERHAGMYDFLRADFVVQQDNFREMADFVKLIKILDADQLTFSLVIDWGTWPKEMYESKCMWKESHPDFDAFLEVLRDPIFSDPIVDLGNLTEYRKRALDRPAA